MPRLMLPATEEKYCITNFSRIEVVLLKYLPHHFPGRFNDELVVDSLLALIKTFRVVFFFFSQGIKEFQS